MPVSQAQRYTPSNPCPVCNGHSRMPKGRGLRCWGFVSECGSWARCTRPELAANTLDRGGYVHRTTGSCRCGVTHSGWLPPLVQQPQAADNSKYARQLWEQAVNAKGTLAHRYLETRAINVEPPNSVRFHSELKHSPTGLIFPALLSGVTVYPSKEITGIQRTFIQADGSAKAPVVPSKMSLGRTTGGAVKLAEPGPILALAEGLETALSVLQAFDIPSWAVLGAGNLSRVILPPLPLAREVRLYIDGDDTSNDAMVEAGDVFSEQGRTVRVFTAPEGLDFNDLLRDSI